MLKKFRQWMAEPLLARLREEHQQQTVDRQREAYRVGHDAGYTQGIAIGQLQGQQLVLNELERYADERREDLSVVTPADIERARKGLVH